MCWDLPARIENTEPQNWKQPETITPTELRASSEPEGWKKVTKLLRYEKL
jgi:hypothetical protein